MKKRFSVEQKIGVLKQAQVAFTVAEVIWKTGISEQTSYRWKAKYVGLEADEVRKMAQLREENTRPKKLAVELTLTRRCLRCSATGRGPSKTRRGSRSIRPYPNQQTSGIAGCSRSATPSRMLPQRFVPEWKTCLPSARPARACCRSGWTAWMACAAKRSTRWANYQRVQPSRGFQLRPNCRNQE